MEKSLFIQYVERWFKGIVTRITERINGENPPQKYHYRDMLRKVYSTDLKWQALSRDGRLVAADVVAMDSSLPLKKRDAIKKADGDIPKLGMKLFLNESEMTRMDVLLAQNENGNLDNQIVSTLFQDTNKVIGGVYEQLERMFLEGLSTGVTVINEDQDNPGLGVRVNYGFSDKNKYGATAKWSGASAKPVDDIDRIIENASAKGDVIQFILMDRKAFNNLRKSDAFKAMVAGGMGYGGTNLPTPTMAQANEALSANYNVQLMVIDRSIQLEANGIRTTVKPWAEGVVVFLTEMQVGSLAWGRSAEMNHRVEGVNYEVADDFILVSKYHKNDPLREFTTSQAFVIPVIDNVDSIYILDTEEATASEDEQTEGDANFSYEGTSYTKASVVDGLNATKEVPTSNVSQTDATLVKKIDSLSEEGVKTFEAALIASA